MKPSFTHIALWISLALLGNLAQAHAQSQSHRFALLVGNNTGGADTNPLRYAVHDANKVRDVLVDLGGFPEQNIRLLRDRRADEVLATLDELTNEMAKLSRDPGQHVLFLFYYSGHGEAEHLELGSSQLAIGTLKEKLKLAPADMRVGIVDACHSGAMVRTKGGRRVQAFPLSVEDERASKGYAILTSSAAGETSQESDELRGSFFTHSLVSGLRGDADYSGDERITLSELYRYAYFSTLERSQATHHGAQHPHFESAQRGDPIITQLEEASALLTFPGDTGGRFVVFHPESDTVLAEVVKERGSPRSIAVRPGTLQIYDRSAATVRRANVRLNPDSELVLDHSQLEEVATVEYATRGDELVVGLSGQVGYQTFHDSGFTRGYVKNLPVYGLEAHLQNLGVPGLGLSLEALFSIAEQNIMLSDSPVEQNLFHTSVGATLSYRLQLRDLHLSAGPRVAFVLFRRDVDTEGLAQDNEVQVYATASPGAELELGYRVMPRLSLNLSGRTSYLHFEADGDSTHMLTTDALLGVEVLF